MTQKHSWAHCMSIIVVLMMMSMTTILSSCSKASEGPELPETNYFIQEFFEGYLISGTMMYSDGTYLEAHIDQNSCWFPEFPIRYSATSKPQVYKSLLDFYGDTGINRELKPGEKKYLPHKSGIEWLKCDLLIIDRMQNDTAIFDIPDPDYLTIKFKTYYPFIKNGYKWPNGMNEWQEMSIKEFNKTAPHYLVDVKEMFFKRDTTTGADKELWDRKPGQIRIWFKFDNGIKVPLYWLIPQGFFEEEN